MMDSTPSLLQLVERDFASQSDDAAGKRIQKLALDVALDWESKSEVFRAGLERIGWWETRFATQLPVTYDRLKKSAGRRANATTLMSMIRLHPETTKNVWRNLLLLQRESERHDQSVWQPHEKGTQIAIHPADEHGIDRIHMIVHREDIPLVRVFQLRRDTIVEANSFDLPSEALWNPKMEYAMLPVQLWTVPFQDALVVLLRSKVNREHELVWIETKDSKDEQGKKLDRDLSLWALNHNNLLEHPGEFLAPPFLQGDATLKANHVLLAATEGRTDIATARTATAAVTIRQRDTLVYDQVKQDSAKAVPGHWRDLLTSEILETRSDTTASCYVLDSFLLYACADGILRAHPRGNPQSVYHVADAQSRVYQMAALFNVVAIVHSVDVLEVRTVERKSEDPFIQFQATLYRTAMVDNQQAPLLYGPYVVFRDVKDGSWVRVHYETQEKHKQPIKVPYHAGWSIESIKSVNWRYWTLALRNPKSKTLEDFLLFAGGAMGEQGTLHPFLGARCMECYTEASHLCGACQEVAFCGEHGKEHTHRRQCASDQRRPKHLKHALLSPVGHVALERNLGPSSGRTTKSIHLAHQNVAAPGVDK